MSGLYQSGPCARADPGGRPRKDQRGSMWHMIREMTRIPSQPLPASSPRPVGRHLGRDRAAVAVCLWCAGQALAQTEAVKPVPSVVLRQTAVPPMFTARALQRSAGDAPLMGPSQRGDAPRLADILGATETGAATLPNTCKKDSSVVCYDPKGGRAVFPFTRSLMPDVQGLQAQGIAVKRDRVLFNYTFR